MTKQNHRELYLNKSPIFVHYDCLHVADNLSDGKLARAENVEKYFVAFVKLASAKEKILDQVWWHLTIGI